MPRSTISITLPLGAFFGADFCVEIGSGSVFDGSLFRAAFTESKVQFVLFQGIQHVSSSTFWRYHGRFGGLAARGATPRVSPCLLPQEARRPTPKTFPRCDGPDQSRHHGTCPKVLQALREIMGQNIFNKKKGSQWLFLSSRS